MEEEQNQVQDMDREVPVGIFFANSDGEGFPGSRYKTGVVLVRAGDTGNAGMDAYARSFIEYLPGYCEKGRVVRAPSLVTNPMYLIERDCSCEAKEVILRNSEIHELADGVGVSGRSTVDILNRLRCCPVCGGGRLTNWRQLDPLEPRSLAMFDELDESGSLVGRRGAELIHGLMEAMDTASGPLRIPGVVALTRYELGNEALPESPLYSRIREKWANHQWEGRPDPYRCDLLNCLSPEAEIHRLVFAADQYSVGLMPVRWADDGFQSDQAKPYKVRIRVFCRQALEGRPPLLKSRQWSEKKRAAARLSGFRSDF